MSQQQDISRLKEQAISYCHSNDLLILNENSSEEVHAPITLSPYPFPSLAFQTSLLLQPHFNILSLNLPSHPLYTNLLEKVKLVDSFVRDLYDCINHASRFEFGVLRSDYMLDDDDNSLKQVELNTVSVSLFGLSPKVTEFHKLNHGNVPENNTLNLTCEAFKQTDALYRSTYNIGRTTAILMVVHEEERNVYDQGAFVATAGLPVLRKTFLELEQISITDETLIVDEYEISIVYWRTGYAPSHYQTCNNAWSIRRRIEQARAIKCPSISLQLTGMKKVQELLALNPSVLVDLDLPQDLANVFVEFYDPTIIVDLCKDKDALSKLVVKPQREGGGNNTYGEKIIDIKDGVKATPAAFVVMQLINSIKHSTTAIRDTVVVQFEGIPELGIYGVLLAEKIDDKWKVHANHTTGYLLRTKPTGENEGGVVHGVSFLDSPELY